MTYKDPKPDILRIEELVKSVKFGDIKLPRFQRPFVWKDKDVRKLLDSIYKGYPIGSILLWVSSEKLASERSIGDLDIVITREDYPTNYLLDGQQRLSTLCGALYWNGKNKESLWNLSFDLEKEEFIHPKDVYRPFYFPLNKLISTSDFINQCKVFDNHEKKEIYYDRAEKLLKSIKDYKIPTVRIGDMTIQEVAPIFERINSTGRKLTVVDLMRAATWKGGFDLNDAINSIKEICEENNFVNIPETHILRNISAYFGISITREDIEKLRKTPSNDMQTATDSTIISYKDAINFIQNTLRIPSGSYIPYSMQTTLIVEFFHLCPSPTLNQERQLVKWFWHTSFSRHFEGGGAGQINKDLQSIRDFALNNTDEIKFLKPIVYTQIFSERLTLNKAISKAFALLLAIRKPRSLLTGELFNNESNFKYVNRDTFHSIFPKTQRHIEGINYESPLNYCLIDPIHNKILGDISPNVWIEAIKKELPNDYINILDSNFINFSAIKAILQNDPVSFFKIRNDSLISAISELIKNYS